MLCVYLHACILEIVLLAWTDSAKMMWGVRQRILARYAGWVNLLAKFIVKQVYCATTNCMTALLQH